jgi:dipeptidyl aminopeptidase/acylaminoacyl peptidase
LRIRKGAPVVPSPPARIQALLASWQPVQIAASDGVALHAWLLRPKSGRAGCVIALHGIGEARTDTLDWAPMLLPEGYCMLTPDNRGMGESGGAVITYGIREVDDVRRWVDWLKASERPENVFGIGESMGGSILLASLKSETRFRALVADSPFSELRSTARENVERRVPLPALLAHPAAATVVTAGFTYGWLRYGLDLGSVSVVDAVRSAKTPILLIHGADDARVRPWHSRALAAVNPNDVQLWIVPGAGHVEAGGVSPVEYRQRVLAWFSDHGRPGAPQ